MSVNKEQLAQYVAELGLSDEQAQSMINTLMANDKAAVQFVGQRLRHSDYTSKTQELAQARQQLDQQVTQQVGSYAQELQQAQERINRIMGDLESAKISEATANARLLRVKEKFNLGDDDIPAVEGVRNPAGTGNPGNQTVDIDAKLNQFKSQLVKELLPDMMAVMDFMPKFADISAQHQELTGQRLTRKEYDEITKHAKENKLNFAQAWEAKYDIPTIRQTKHDEQVAKSAIEKYEAEQKRKKSEDALAGVRQPAPDPSSFQSPVLRKQFVTDPSGDKTAPAGQVPQHQTPAPPASGPRLSGAERAAARFLERRSMGIPMGQPEPATR